MSHYHDCPQCYARVPCAEACSVEPDTGAGHHLVCDVCDGAHKEEEAHAARLAAAARELLEALPRCDRLRCSASGPAMFVDYTYQGPEYLCEKHAGRGKITTAAPWAEAAAKLAAALEER